MSYQKEVLGERVTRGTVQIEVYEPPVSTESHGANQATARTFFSRQLLSLAHSTQSRCSAAVIRALASLLLHAALITALAWGGGGHAHPFSPHQPNLGTGESREYAMELISIQEQPESTEQALLDPDPNTSPALTAVKLDLSFVAANLAPLLDDTSTASGQSAGDSATAALVGRYLGQIDARIERAWVRPRDPIKEGVFSCRARIEQDATGVVREITLERCNGNSRWQLSLVHAIQLASPLPAPPDAQVFRRLLRLNFQAQPYSADAPEELYETPVVTGTASNRP